MWTRKTVLKEIQILQPSVHTHSSTHALTQSHLKTHTQTTTYAETRTHKLTHLSARVYPFNAYRCMPPTHRQTDTQMFSHRRWRTQKRNLFVVKLFLGETI